MKSKASNPKRKSPSREDLIKSANEQYKLMVRKRAVAAQDEIPTGWFSVGEMSKRNGMEPSSMKKQLDRLKVPKRKFRVFTGQVLQRVDYYQMLK